MANKNSNVSYDQIPHIVVNHPKTTPEHKEIMRALFKVLKDKPQCIYSNEALSEICRIPVTTLRRRLNDLQSWGFINRCGHSYARRFSLGLLFDTASMVTGSKLNTASTVTATSSKTDPDLVHGGRDTNPSTNTSTKDNRSFSFLNHFETKELELCVSMKVPLSNEFKYLQPLLNKALEHE
jgi:DNA-binding Lrp family transcriptional regulator